MQVYQGSLLVCVECSQFAATTCHRHLSAQVEDGMPDAENPVLSLKAKLAAEEACLTSSLATLFEER